MQQIHGVSHFAFWPKTYVLPKEFDLLIEEMRRDPYRYWIVKPSASAQGKGIYMTNSIRDIPKG